MRRRSFFRSMMAGAMAPWLLRAELVGKRSELEWEPLPEVGAGPADGSYWIDATTHTISFRANGHTYRVPIA